MGGRHWDAWALADVMLGRNRGNRLITGGLCEGVPFVKLGSVGRMTFSMSNAKILSNEISVAVRVVATIDGLRSVFIEG